ncbi:MAG: hypothetical protein HXX14_01160 [Bacteroidetes bacterium]|nr:hypothetical protein [Bacteroidota bacterium]
MDKGFVIRKLILTGQKVDHAIIEFATGLNVISGPTNTGKSYIFECLDFMMGGKVLPRDIVESRSYESIFLEIEANNTYYTLERARLGGDFKLYETKFDFLNFNNFTVLLSKHDKDNENTISAFLLKLNNIWDKKIRKNNKGVLVTLSYRYICHLLLISEIEIIKKESPILSSKGFGVTIEPNVIKFLVSGKDDKAIIAEVDEKIITSKKGKIELLNELIKDISDNNPEIGNNEDLDHQIQKLENSIGLIKEEHNILLDEFSEKDAQRKIISKEILILENRIDSLIEILNRSSLLKEHYNTDIKRLKSTIEAGILLSNNEINTQLCPYCKNELNEVLNSDEIVQTINACEKEIIKIIHLLQELSKSVELMKEKKIELDFNLISLNKSLQEIETHLEENVNSKLKDQNKQLDNLNRKRNLLLQSKYQENSFKQFNDFRESLTKSLNNPKAGNEFDTLTTSVMQPICEVVAKILKECYYENPGSVTFSEKSLDLIIGNENRNLSGKGLRAITYATFILALTEYITEKDYRIGVPVFDSPLVTFSKPKAEGEGITIDLAMNFYRYCALKSKCEQIIILENEEPPNDIETNINHIRFTGLVDVGRKGFIPVD